MEYLITGSYVESGSFSNLLTSGGSNKLLLKGIHCTNVATASAQITLKWVDSSDSNKEYFIAKDVVIPNASSFQAIDSTFVLDNGDSLKAEANISNSIQASVSYMQITNSEG